MRHGSYTWRTQRRTVLHYYKYFVPLNLTHIQFTFNISAQTRWQKQYTTISTLTEGNDDAVPDWNTQICNVNSYFVWVWNLVPHTKGRTQIEGVWEQGAEENIWISEEVAGDWRRLSNEELHKFLRFTNY
jgi:hypothetical protein